MYTLVTAVCLLYSTAASTLNIQTNMPFRGVELFHFLQRFGGWGCRLLVASDPARVSQFLARRKLQTTNEKKDFAKNNLATGTPNPEKSM
jgi:hypothetical protein